MSSKIVYATVESFDQIAGAAWTTVDAEKYAAAQNLAEIAAMKRGDAVCLVGRQNQNGVVQIVRAKGLRALSSAWFNINGFHLTLARFFWVKLDEAPAGERLNPFFETIDAPDAADAAVQLVAADVGANASAEDRHSALQRIGHSLRALGVPAADWSYVPMLATVSSR